MRSKELLSRRRRFSVWQFRTLNIQQFISILITKQKQKKKNFVRTKWYDNLSLSSLKLHHYSFMHWTLLSRKISSRLNVYFIKNKLKNIENGETKRQVDTPFKDRFWERQKEKRIQRYQISEK